MKILITGASGMLGSHIHHRTSLLGETVFSPSHQSLDLLDFGKVKQYFNEKQPDLVIHCAAVVGGIIANTNYPSKFILENLRIDSNVVQSALDSGTPNFLYLISSCVYPKDFFQPLREDFMLGGPLEPTNEGYAVAKIAGTQMIKSIALQFGLNYRALVASNLYGPRDTFEPENSHLIAAALQKTFEARKNNSPSVFVGGSGKAKREFTYVADIAEWIAKNLTRLNEFPLVMNIGSGMELTVEEYFKIAAEVTGFKGNFESDPRIPDGMARKLLDSTMVRDLFSWSPQTQIIDGMRQTFDWWRSQ
jgi:GDP-L-fucose synthase